MCWLGSLHAAKQASPAATHRISEKKVVNSLLKRNHRGSRATSSTPLRPYSCSRLPTAARLKPATVLFRLATASSGDSWWILMEISLCGTFLYIGYKVIFGAVNLTVSVPQKL